MSSPSSASRARAARPLLPMLLVILAAGATVGVLLLIDNINQRKIEAMQPFQLRVQVDETTVDPAVWGQNFPRQYDTYRLTAEMHPDRRDGDKARQKLDLYPVWRDLWAGYPFAVDYREARGHAYMLEDQRATLRVTEFAQPGACLHCHASVYTAYRQAGVEQGAPGAVTDPLDSPEGRAQLFAGFEHINPMPYHEATQLVNHPVSCIDCHDPRTLNLRITRPAFMTGIQELAKSDQALPHLPSIERWRQGSREEEYDANRHASHHEMRSLVCAQCHVEYYFKGPERRLVYPWHRGLKVEDMEAFYDEIGFTDWVHAKTGSPLLKAQHPEFELWSQGTHAQAGVSCADCHMPYRRVGAAKISDHQIRSPLLDLSRSCQVCHRVEDRELLARVEAIQDRTRALTRRAESAVMQLVLALQAAIAEDAPEAALNEARQLHRKAQWRLDFVFSENSLGFHAPQESARILGEAIDYARQGQVVLLQARTQVAVR